MVASAAGLLLASRSARAAPADFELTWSAPAGCPSRKAIVDATRARLGESRSGGPAELFVQGTVTAERGGFLITLALKDKLGHSIGEREVRVDGAQRRAVEEPAALLPALPSAPRRADAPRPPQEAPPSPEAPDERSRVEPVDAPRPPPSEPTAPPATTGPVPSERPTRTSSPPSRVAIGVAGVASLGLLPDAGLGGALRATYARGPLLVGLEASFESGGSVRAGTGEVGFQFVGASALFGLQVLRMPRVELSLTTALRAGVIRTSSTGFAVVRSETSAALLAGPGVLIRAKLAPHLFAEALPEIDGILIRDQFRIRDGEKLDIHRPAPFGGRLSLGLGYEFR